MSKKIVLAGACRTAIGTMGGSLSTTPAAELGSIVIKEALNRAGVAPEKVDHVYMGCVIQAGLGQNVARQASIKAGLPIETPAVTVNVVCGSGLNCVNMAAQMILAGDADIVVAGGMENMSMAPFALPNARFGYRMNNGTLVDTMVNDALWDAFNQYHMIQTADNICNEWNLTREELDEFALKSQQKAEPYRRGAGGDAGRQRLQHRYCQLQPGAGDPSGLRHGPAERVGYRPCSRPVPRHQRYVAARRGGRADA